MGISERAAEPIDLTLPCGRNIRVRRRPGRGATMVLLHGMLDSSEGWSEIAQATERPTVAFDLPGFGGSDLPTQPCLSAFAQDIAAAMDQMGLRDVMLVGHSLGGAVATAVAELVPDRLASLVLLAPAGFGRIALAEAVSLPGVRSFAAAALPLWLNAPVVLDASYKLFVTAGRSPAKGVIERVRREAAALVPSAILATEAVVAAGRSRQGFHRRRVNFHGPVAALWGKADRVVPAAHASGLKRAFPQAQLTLWPGMGHHPQHERTAELLSFLETAGVRATAGQRSVRADCDSRRVRVATRPRPALATA